MNEYINIIEQTATYPEIKRDHAGCPAGRDTKQRLFVKREGAKTLAFCHNCGLSGVLSSKEVSSIRRGGENLLIDGPLHLPPDMELATAQQPVEHVAWLNKYGIGPAAQRDNNIGWSAQYGRTILPVYSLSGELTAYQRRNVSKYDLGPKYLTTRARKLANTAFWNLAAREDKQAGGVIVITEDILSAIKVGMAGYPAVALLGTYLTNETVETIAAAEYTQAVVWLDDDNFKVRKSQKTMRKMLAQYMGAYVMKRGDLGLRGDSPADPKMFKATVLDAHIQAKIGV
jgi:hypothetical protein